MIKQSDISIYIMTYKGLKTLEDLIKLKYEKYIGYIVIGKDKNTVNDYSEEIKIVCESNDIFWIYAKDPVPFKTTYIIAISWRWIIKAESTLIIFHDSLLPKYRGFAPLVNQLINQEPIIGVTVLYGEEEYDTGDIIAQEKLQINYPIKINNAIEAVSKLYGRLAIKIFTQLIKTGQLVATKQRNESASYSLWRDESDYAINWDNTSEFIFNFVNSLGFPYHGASTFLENRKVRILNTQKIPDVSIENRNAGKIIFFKKNKPVIVCGSGLLKINEAVYDDTKESIFPMKNFRIKFK